MYLICSIRICPFPRKTSTLGNSATSNCHSRGSALSGCVVGSSIISNSGRVARHTTTHVRQFDCVPELRADLLNLNLVTEARLTTRQRQMGHRKPASLDRGAQTRM